MNEDLICSDLNYDWFSLNPIKLLISGKETYSDWGDVGWKGGSPKATMWNEVHCYRLEC